MQARRINTDYDAITVKHLRHGVGLNMAAAQRIVSFLPAATEMVCALGLAERLLGVTHECDYPPKIRGKPVVVRSTLPVETMSEAEIDVYVSEQLKNGLSLYQVDERLIEEIAPDLILTQNLCQVCAPSGDDASQALTRLACAPKILWFAPKCLEDIFDNLRELGAACGRSDEAEILISMSRARLEAIACQTRSIARPPKVFCMEWIDPVYCSGHWLPQMVRIAGGVDALGREGTLSVRIGWDAVRNWAPDVLIVMPCGFDAAKAANHAMRLFAYPGYREIPAVLKKRVYAVNANAYFARPGPRVVDGTELLAHLIHPELFPWNGPADAFQKLD